MVYPVIDVPEGLSTQLEQLGSKSKFWFVGSNGLRTLFKEGRPGTGENWAEKVCCEVCRLLGLPHAEYDLATCAGREGIVSPSFAPEGARLIHGNELLVRVVKDYQEEGKRYRRRNHTVKTVMTLTGLVAPPVGWRIPERIGNGADVFVGYLLLDALVGNQDRHDENWGFLAVPNAEIGMSVSLAPTFDHASSLGRNESDETRHERMSTKDRGRSVEAFVARATSAFFASGSTVASRPLPTLEAFTEAATIAPGAAEVWLRNLSQLSEEQFAQILADLPPPFASETAREFALRMVEINRARLLGTSEW